MPLQWMTQGRSSDQEVAWGFLDPHTSLHTVWMSQRESRVVSGDIGVCQHVSQEQHAQLCKETLLGIYSDTSWDIESCTASPGASQWPGALTPLGQCHSSLLRCQLCLSWWTWIIPDIFQNCSSFLVTPTLRKLDEFWTEGCHETQIYLETTFLQFEWKA